MSNLERADDRGEDYVPLIGDLVGLWRKTDPDAAEPIIEGFVVDYRPLEGLIIVKNGVDNLPVKYFISQFTIESLPLEEIDNVHILPIKAVECRMGIPPEFLIKLLT